LFKFEQIFGLFECVKRNEKRKNLISTQRDSRTRYWT